MVLLGAAAASREAVATALIVMGAALMPVAVLLPRLIGSLKLGPQGLEAELAAVVDAADAIQPHHGQPAGDADLLVRGEVGGVGTSAPREKQPTPPDIAIRAGEPHWYQWSPHIARSRECALIAEAVAEFDAGDSPGSREAARWLRHEALAAHPSILTYIAVAHERVEGYVAIQGAQVALHGRSDQTPRQTAPASFVPRYGLHRKARVTFRELFLYAAWIALKVGKLQGNLVFVVAPFDNDSADALKEFGFRESRTDRGAPKRLWMPLH
jgi:hypothetical protein